MNTPKHNAGYKQVLAHMGRTLRVEEHIAHVLPDASAIILSEDDVLDIGNVSATVLEGHVLRITCLDDDMVAHTGKVSCTRIAADGKRQVYINLDYSAKVDVVVNDAYVFHVDDHIDGGVSIEYYYMGNFDD